jgi:hypothetical protein
VALFGRGRKVGYHNLSAPSRAASSETHFRLNWNDASKEFDSAQDAFQGEDPA